MAHTVFFGFEIELIFSDRINNNWDTLFNFQSITVDPDDFSRIVGHQPDTFDSEIQQYLGTDAIFPQIGGESEFFVGFDGIAPLLLKFVCVQFIFQSDPPSFLPHIDQNAAAFGGDHFHCGMELISAITAGGAENITGQTFTVDPHQNGIFVPDITADQSKMGSIINF